jgi:hypothetical protein
MPGGGRYQFIVAAMRRQRDFGSRMASLPAAASIGSRYQLEAQTADPGWCISPPEVSWGDFFSGQRRDFSVQVDVRPRRGFAVSMEAERNLLELAEGSFTADVYRLDANTQFSPWISLANNLQYDTVSRLLGWQLRFRWIQRPGNDLYIVYTHNWHERFEVGRVANSTTAWRRTRLHAGSADWWECRALSRSRKG